LQPLLAGVFGVETEISPSKNRSSGLCIVNYSEATAVIFEYPIKVMTV
jgi:hypothetical protein